VTTLGLAAYCCVETRNNIPLISRVLFWMAKAGSSDADRRRASSSSAEYVRRAAECDMSQCYLVGRTDGDTGGLGECEVKTVEAAH